MLGSEGSRIVFIIGGNVGITAVADFETLSYRATEK